MEAFTGDVKLKGEKEMRQDTLKAIIEDIINNPYKAPEVKYNEMLDMLANAANLRGQEQERERCSAIVKEIYEGSLLTEWQRIKLMNIITGSTK